MEHSIGRIGTQRELFSHQSTPPRVQYLSFKSAREEQSASIETENTLFNGEHRIAMHGRLHEAAAVATSAP
jgi:hypothetical protein